MFYNNIIALTLLCDNMFLIYEYVHQLDLDPGSFAMFFKWRWVSEYGWAIATIWSYFTDTCTHHIYMHCEQYLWAIRFGP